MCDQASIHKGSQNALREARTPQSIDIDQECFADPRRNRDLGEVKDERANQTLLKGLGQSYKVHKKPVREGPLRGFPSGRKISKEER